MPPQFYYLFGFLFLVFIILIITCAEITIVLCYFQLCSEDYNWWYAFPPSSLSPILWTAMLFTSTIEAFPGPTFMSGIRSPET